MDRLFEDNDITIRLIGNLILKSELLKADDEPPTLIEIMQEVK